MSEIKVVAYNEKVKTAMEALLNTTVELKGKAVVEFEVEIGADQASYTLLGTNSVVTFRTEDIVIEDENGESVTLEALKNYVYNVVIDGAEHTFTASEQSRQLNASRVAEKIFNILLNAKKIELGLGKTARVPSESRAKNEKLKAEKLLLAQLRAKQKAAKQAKAAVVVEPSEEL